CDRKLEVERRATPVAAALTNRTSIRFDDDVADRQAKAGSLADGLGGKERLKQLRLVFCRHAGPIVLNLEADFLSRIEQANHNVSSLPSGGFERLLRVDHEIERHLLELGKVRMDVANRRRLDVERDGGRIEIAAPQL